MLKAPNSGAFTLDGSRAYLVGKGEMALIDPGPNVEEHVRALLDAVGSATKARILLTHDHSDHAGAAEVLAESSGIEVFGPASTGYSTLEEGDAVSTDEGELQVWETPGHTADHLSFYWPRADALFVGDLVLGTGTTSWVGEYLGCVGDYLRSLDRIRQAEPGVLYPGHGPPIRDVIARLTVFEEHRLRRLEQVEKARAARPDATPDQIVESVYRGRLPSRMVKAARASVEAMLHHLDTLE
jgi:glyoxylase-like metal-dependent hydrolase (beta-lactamase superfamily II)